MIIITPDQTITAGNAAATSIPPELRRQVEQSNDLLMGILEADTQRGTVSLVPALIQDLSGRTNFISSRAWIKREPNVVFGREVEEREWMIGAVPSTYFIGGNQ